MILLLLVFNAVILIAFVALYGVFISMIEKVQFLKT